MIHQQSLSTSDSESAVESSEGQDITSDLMENPLDQQLDPENKEINNIDSPAEQVIPSDILPPNPVFIIKASSSSDVYPTSPVEIPKLKPSLLPDPGVIQNFSNFFTPPLNPKYPDAYYAQMSKNYYQGASAEMPSFDDMSKVFKSQLDDQFINEQFSADTTKWFQQSDQPYSEQKMRALEQLILFGLWKTRSKYHDPQLCGICAYSFSVLSNISRVCCGCSFTCKCDKAVLRLY